MPTPRGPVFDWSNVICDTCCVTSFTCRTPNVLMSFSVVLLCEETAVNLCPRTGIILVYESLIHACVMVPVETFDLTRMCQNSHGISQSSG